MPKRIWPVVPLVSLLACAVFAALWVDAERRGRAALSFTRAASDSTSPDVGLPRPPLGLSRSDTLYWAWVTINQQVHIKRLEKQLVQERMAARTALDETQVLALRNRGLGDPSQALRDSLTAHPELVPWPGYEFDRSTIVVLPPPLVYAGADDGTSLGHVLLRYEVAPDGRVTWERVWAGLDTP